ncbi:MULTISPECIES: universal stress protein [Haloprofundus]|uniref:universal stress protein n=1 Tax=Haloprofundus TaxID=1911573 RepID=UPI000E44DC1E|nr:MULTISPECIES: universal stress protein [Haloprofundus]QCJ47705.1 universal stress protein [Haloprofundus sp. MHR1]
MYERILVPTDGSAVAELAVSHAVDLAERYGAELHALYVVDIDAVNLGLGTEQVDRIRQGHFSEMGELESRATESTGVVAAAAGDRGIDVVEEIRVGRPHKVIANYAEKEDVDLVVMGSHGRAGVSRALLGSVTERVLRSTHVPVLVVDRQGAE